MNDLIEAHEEPLEKDWTKQYCPYEEDVYGRLVECDCDMDKYNQCCEDI